MRAIFILSAILISTHLFSQKAYTPEKGSKERTEILNIFREDFGEEKSSILFKVDHFLIKNIWACASVSPLKNGASYGEPRWGLFQNINETWTKVNWSQGIEFNNDFELIDLPQKNSRIANLIVNKFPQCSMEIFGN
jgi:hypothetical protein